MEKWNVVIEALQPISIASMPDRETHWDTTIIIPGSTLRGAVAEEWRNRIGFDHPLTSQLFQQGRWCDALPEGTELITADLFYSKRTQEKKSILADYIRQQLTSLKVNENDSLLPAEQGIVNDYLVLNQAVNISVSPTRNAARHGYLYSLSAIAEGTLFTARATLPREALQLLNETGQGDDISFTCYIGKKRSSGYGKVRVTFQEPKQDEESIRQDLWKRIKEYNMLIGNEDFEHGTWYIALISISPLILLDRFLRYAMAIDWETHICDEDEHKPLKDLFSEKGKLVVSWGVSSMRHGWNSAWNLPKQAEWVLKPGTIHVFKFTNLTFEEQKALVDLLISLEEKGIGERREEGFGQVIVNHWIGDKPKRNVNVTQDTNVSETVAFDSKVLEKAEKFAKEIESVIKKSQLYELQQYAAEKIVEQICGKGPDCYIEKRLVRKSKNGWKRKIEFDGNKQMVGEHLRNIVNEWRERDGEKKAGEKAKAFLRYVIGYYDIHHNG